MKTKLIERLLEENGFYLKRANKHRIFSNGYVTIPLPYGSTISPGLGKAIIKQLGAKHV